MINYYNGADEIVMLYPKGMPRDFNEDEKYYKKIIRYTDGVPEFDDAVNNEDYDSSAQLEIKKNEIRVVRDKLLADEDYVFIRHQEEKKLVEESTPDVSSTLSNSDYVKYLKYKRELRKLVNKITSWDDVINLTYPTKP